VERSAPRGDEAAIRLLTAAADAAAPRAPGAAARWLGGALRLLPEWDQERRAILLIPLATALSNIGSVDERGEALLRALALVSNDQPLVKARLVGTIARIDHMVGRHGAARAMLEQAIDEAGSECSIAALALKLELAMDYWFAADWPEDLAVPAQ